MVTTSTAAPTCERESVRAAQPIWSFDAPRALFPWKSRGFPCSETEERWFVTELSVLAGGVTREHTRGDITAIANALRSGITVHDLLDVAPGLKPSRLLSAYTDLERRRREGEDAWQEVLRLGSSAGVLLNSARAGTLVPAVMTQLELLAFERPEMVPHAIDRCRRRAELAAEVAEAFETRLEGAHPDDPDARRIGARLYDPEMPSAWGDAFYVPRRVADLVPERVTALLRERSVER